MSSKLALLGMLLLAAAVGLTEPTLADAGAARAPLAATDDTTPPVSVLGGADGLWHNAAIPISIDAVDPGFPDDPTASGVALFEERLLLGQTEVFPWSELDYVDEGAVHVTTDDFQLTDGVWSLGLRATDNAGNVEAPHYYTFMFDSTAPSVLLGGVDDGGTYNSDQQAVLTAFDSPPDPDDPEPDGMPAVLLPAALPRQSVQTANAGGSPGTDARLAAAATSSGVDSVEWQLEGASQWTLVAGETATIDIPASNIGTFTYLYRATDKAGNVGEALSFTVNMIAPSGPDVTPPEVIASGADAKWHHGPVTVSLSATDPGVPGAQTGRGLAPISSGVKQIEYREQDAADWTTAPGDAATITVPADANGEHAFDYRALDNAGLYSATGRFVVRIDSMAPLVHQFNDATTVRGGVVRLFYRLGDNLSRALDVRLVITRSGRVCARRDLGTRKTGTRLTAKLRCPFRAGSYSWRILATDLAKNSAWGNAKRLRIRPR